MGRKLGNHHHPPTARSLPHPSPSPTPPLAGYTPLHMAAGYMHTTTIAALLAAGADPEQEDREGRSPLALVESLRAALPPNNPMLVSRRMALEEVIKVGGWVGGCVSNDSCVHVDISPHDTPPTPPPPDPPPHPPPPAGAD